MRRIGVEGRVTLSLSSNNRAKRIRLLALMRRMRRIDFTYKLVGVKLLGGGRVRRTFLVHPGSNMYLVRESRSIDYYLCREPYWHGIVAIFVYIFCVFLYTLLIIGYIYSAEILIVCLHANIYYILFVLFVL